MGVASGCDQERCTNAKRCGPPTGSIAATVSLGDVLTASLSQGTALLEMGEHEQALRHYQLASQLAPTNQVRMATVREPARVMALECAHRTNTPWQAAPRAKTPSLQHRWPTM